MSQMVDQGLEPDYELEQPAWVTGWTDAGDRGQRAPSPTRAVPHLTQTLQAAVPVIGRAVQLALPAVLAVLASRALDQRLRRSDVAANCPQADGPGPGGNATLEVWVAQTIVIAGRGVSRSDICDWAALTIQYLR